MPIWAEYNPELLYDLPDIAALQNIDIRIRFLQCDHQLIHVGIAHVKADNARIIKKDAKGRLTGNH